MCAVTPVRQSCGTGRSTRRNVSERRIYRTGTSFARRGCVMMSRFSICVLSVPALPPLFRTSHQTSILVSCCCQADCILLYRRCDGLHREKAGCKMTAAVRKKDEGLTINLKRIIGVLMTDSVLWRMCPYLPSFLGFSIAAYSSGDLSRRIASFICLS